MRHDHGTAGELEKGVLQGPQGLDVEVVRRLIEQEQVSALLEREREVEAIALTAGEHSGLLLLVRSLESERCDIAARGHLHGTHVDEVESGGCQLPMALVGVDLPQALVRVDASTGLIDVGDLDRVTDLEFTAVELFEADDGLEQRRLSDAVGADDSDDAVARQGEAQPIDELTSVEALFER